MMEITQKVALTRQGISILMDAPVRRMEFTVQIIYIAKATDKMEQFLGRCIVIISDGFTWIKGRLKPIKKSYDLIEKIQNYAVVSILGKDFEKSEDGRSFLLKNLKIVTSKLKGPIGKPVHFPDYYDRKEHIDLQQGNQFEIDKFISIKEVKTFPLGRVKGCVLAKIVRIPVNPDKVMNVLIEDQEDSMYCCFFGHLVAKYHSTLVQGKWYLFESPVMHRNHLKPNELQLKVKGQVKLANKETPNIPKRQVSQSKSSISQKEQQPSKQFNMNETYSKQDLVYIIARPLLEYNMKDSLGKCYNCVDKFGKTVEILIWRECDCVVEVNKTYRFDGLRIKSINQKITLQSHRQRTKVEPTKIKILSRMEMMKSKQREKKRSEVSLNKPREVGKNETIITIQQFLQGCQKYNANIQFAIVQGYISSQFQPSPKLEPSYLKQIQKRIFYFNCKTCSYSSNDTRPKGEPLLINEVVVCLICKSRNHIVMWNLKAYLHDKEINLPCQINNEIVEKVLDMAPPEGLLIFLQNPNQLLLTIQKDFYFKKGIFKISCKHKSGVRYFNIYEHYAYKTSLVNQLEVKRLKEIEEKYKACRVGRSKKKVNVSSWMTDAESYDNQG